MNQLNTMKKIKIIAGLLFTGLTITYLLQFVVLVRGAGSATGVVAGFAPICLAAAITFALFYSAFRNPMAKRAQ